MTAAALVLLMTLPGLALFYGGMVRKKNLLSTMMHSFSIATLVGILWVAVGYSLAFTPGNAFIGGLGRVFLSGMQIDAAARMLTVSPNAPTVPEPVFMFFQMTFAIISTAIITGAFAERMKYSAMMLFSGIWFLLVYVPGAHWVWGGGFMSKGGVLDYLKRYGGAHQCRYRGTRRRLGFGQAHRLRARGDASAQYGDDADWRGNVVVRLVRL